MQGYSATFEDNERPVAQAVALEDKPVIDGEVLNDPLWQNITPFGNLVQVQPNFGKPATGP